MNKPDLTVILASPRGFCAGVDRAISIVEKALEKYGAPVYVRHEIVHNKFVVDSLRAKGAIFVKDLDEVPAGSHVIFSAHGVPKSIPQAAIAANLEFLDATCPLVSKVHREVEHHYKAGHTILLVGHRGHPEVIGTMGQVPEGSVILIETEEDARTVTIADPANLAYATQTTLSVDEVTGILAILKERFPTIHGPRKEDICYATTNRQAAVKAIAPQVEAMIVIGAPNSSNSNRLVEAARLVGCAKAALYQRAQDIDWDWLMGVSRLGLSAGASAPEILVDELIDALKEKFNVTVEEIRVIEENIVFHLPAKLRKA
ncbi:4-hydroxy-3-methylbut-2-enyl diphosphate reductase [Candidatus Odyssella acanthamoebae]|uniref:4-hydroxy-3-methylbut-2-enyl diphosphate reductase n=1 Tax=Candidatus Odyssella acanthamoebae TaxID=91604 RepID=A0A077AZ17_9PROT|nr:4-hydroxy-3-methylbut-2-enyl diphosphate reductase [Candidatus Paracaedibacter acanthamoebae]AIK97259.1 4-hydroxy-3-methylbut-2-enyl diphosphate reductase [Candidatus Paracaedibacter acanthamoebae]